MFRAIVVSLDPLVSEAIVVYETEEGGVVTVTDMLHCEYITGGEEGGEDLRPKLVLTCCVRWVVRSWDSSLLRFEWVWVHCLD